MLFNLGIAIPGVMQLLYTHGVPLRVIFTTYALLDAVFLVLEWCVYPASPTPESESGSDQPDTGQLRRLNDDQLTQGDTAVRLEVSPVEPLLSTPFLNNLDDARRVVNVAEFEASGTIEGWMIEYTSGSSGPIARGA